MTNQELFEEWVNTRPECIQVVAREIDPFHFYTLKETGQKVTPISYTEMEGSGPVTLRIQILQEDNPGLAFSREVFGIKPESLIKGELR